MTEDTGSEGRKVAVLALRGLMTCEHLGDVHREIDALCDGLGIPRLEGDYYEGWTDDDWALVDRLVAGGNQ
jgi:hypothetical protein